VATAFFGERPRRRQLVGVALVIGLATVALADVLFLNLRERAPELVTLRSLGWHERHLRRVIALEALLLGTIGSGAGALVALGIGVLLAVPTGWLALSAALALTGGIVVALIASLAPLTQLSRLTPPGVLAAE